MIERGVEIARQHVAIVAGIERGNPDVPKAIRELADGAVGRRIEIEVDVRLSKPNIVRIGLSCV